MSGSPRLLVVRLSSLGDVVMATSVLTSLRERNPAAHITVLTFEPYSPLFRNHPCVDEVLAPPRTLEGMGAWFRYGLSLRDRRFDAVLDLHYNWRTLALGAALFPVPVRRWRRDHHRRRQLLGAGPCGRSLPHMVERYHAALGPWGSGRVDAPHVVGSRSDWEAARELLERLGGAGGRWLGLVPVARWSCA